MLTWSVIFFIVAIMAGLLGFGGIASTSASIAQVFFFIFLIGFIISMVLHFTRRIDSKTKL